MNITFNQTDPFDVKESHIEFYIDEENTPVRFLKIVMNPQPKLGNRDEWKEHTKAQSKEARRLWLDRFKEPMPEHVNAYPAETLSARSKWYEGSRKLTPQEIEFLDNLEGFDFTMDMLWLVVEKCGWYIGQPVSLKDPKWELVRPWDDECVSYGECVLGGLNMGSVGYEGTGKDMKWLIGKYLPQKNR